VKNLALSATSGNDSSGDESEPEVMFDVKALYDYVPDAAAMAKSQKLPFKGPFFFFFACLLYFF